jgi:DNA recombination-dependent growth factor C
LSESHSGHQSCPLSEEAVHLETEIVGFVLVVTAKEKSAESAVATFTNSLEGLQQHVKIAEEEIRVIFTSLQVEWTYVRPNLLGIFISKGMH